MKLIQSLRVAAARLIAKAYVSTTPVSPDLGWFGRVREPFTGSWQRDIQWSADTVLAYHAVYTCITLIANDIGKLRQRLREKDGNGIWSERDSPAFTPVLTRPNRYQNHIQFKQWWITSKLIRGNAYGLKVRDNRGVVTAVYVIDPCKVQVLVSPDGSIFYPLGQDNLTGDLIGNADDRNTYVPASEIIHDRMNCLFHPLVGVSPLFAAGLAAAEGLRIQNNAANFFGNNSQPGGILTAPGAISDETAARLKEKWDSMFSGTNAGKVAVVGDNLKFEAMRTNAVDSQMIEQLRWTAEVVCSVFHVPARKAGIGASDQATANVEAEEQRYYSQCLQILIEEYEQCFADGLGVNNVTGKTYDVNLDLDGLLRMDTPTLMTSLTAGVGGMIYCPNEARKKLNLSPIAGGDTVYGQQQDYSLAALNERDKTNPLAVKPNQEPAATAPIEEDPEEDDTEEAVRSMADLFIKGLKEAA